MKISVIVPIYNVKKYIELSITSICEQTFNDYEIILVNDGSPDDSVQIAENIINKFGKTYSLINKKNGGLPSARNIGIENANGDFVCFIDSDDVIAPTHLQELYDACHKFDTYIAFSDFQLTSEKNRKGNSDRFFSPYKILKNQLLENFLIRKLKIHCCALLIKKDYLVEKKILFNEKLRYGEDIDFMWRLFPTIDAISATGNNTYKYLIRENSLMTKQNIERVELLCKEFQETVYGLEEQYPNERYIWKYLYAKALLAFYRTFAEASQYEDFILLLNKTNYKNEISKIFGIKSVKLNILAIFLLIHPKIFYSVIRKNGRA